MDVHYSRAYAGQISHHDKTAIFHNDRLELTRFFFDFFSLTIPGWQLILYTQDSLELDKRDLLTSINQNIPIFTILIIALLTACYDINIPLPHSNYRGAIFSPSSVDRLTNFSYLTAGTLPLQ